MLFSPQSNNCLVPVRIAVKNGAGEGEGGCNKKVQIFPENDRHGEIP